LLRRVVGLCHLTGVALDPRVAFHAACALRVCQLQDGARLDGGNDGADALGRSDAERS
jgi:hypothetical protein